MVSKSILFIAAALIVLLAGPCAAYTDGAIVPDVTLPPTPIGGDQAWYSIHCNVDGATITFDGKYQGTISGGVLTVPVYVTGTPYSTVTAEKSGYNPDSTGLPQVSAGQTANVFLTLNPVAPTTGTIVVKSTPTGANVYLDGVYNGRTQQYIDGVSPGQHQIRVEKPGYQPWVSTVRVTSNVRTDVQADLVAQPTFGTVSVTCSPSGAHIYLDGTYMGAAPKVLSGIAQGTHLVELELAGYNEWSTRITVVADQVSYVSTTLTPVSSPTTGSLIVSSNPAGAGIYLDGAYEGTTRTGGTVISDVSAGSHSIRLTLHGYEDSTVSVTVNSGQQTPVSSTLTPTASPATGSIAISSAPAGATVYLDNANRGITPLTLDAVAPGSHSLTIRLDGYEDWAGTVEVTAGQTSQVSPTLNEKAAPAPTDSGAAPLPALATLVFVGIVLTLRRIR
jgi:hypothetical protein